MKCRILQSNHFSVQPGMEGEAEPYLGGFAVTFKNFRHQFGANGTMEKDTTIWFPKKHVLLYVEKK